MLDRIIRFSISNKLIVGVFILVLIAWGSYSITQLPIDAVPDITNNQVQLLTIAPSQAAQDIERLVTFPIEQGVSNIPGIQEIRSFSRFGLSVVTVVFKDDIDIYWARQQISERLNTIKDMIPAQIGTPVLAPVSTGLGEIYQYVLKPEAGYENTYSLTDLRTMQDWIVRRQLLGVEGVADVGSFGGKLKQYEIAIDPTRLRSMNVSIKQIFKALEENNQNTGGAYIDKKPNAYYLRSEGLIESINDIEQIVVTENQNGTPILLKNVANVTIGFATRYGAMVYNDKGETTGGIVLMLKGANSSKVITSVKNRIAQIEKTLPKGVKIEAFLDRSKLVESAIKTVTKNLVEGALIVIFILVLFLGNLRAGLIVASVIPLAMLFAVSLMNVFGVSGNLMSLGAIDFGLIVDGAVIIVEATMHHLVLRGNIRLTQQQMDEEVGASASKIRTAAAFGEIIILIVYFPILALVGIEGKMFKPMAQTVSFAIIGALLLSLTYVPMVSALFLSKTISDKRTFSDKLIAKLNSIYQPILIWCMKHAKQTVALSLGLFVGALLLFSTLGAEFIPALDEGDFAIDTRILLGGSLTQTIESVEKSAGILLKAFPNEVEKVVSKIGSSEIPTDPMPIEAADLMVILKPKAAWTKAKTTTELAEKMSQTLSVIPGVTFGFQHPIQMRFNELMTGAKQDVVIKVYGEDLDMLKDYSEKIGKLLPSIEGAKDIYIEKVTGLPQIVIRYNRTQMARFGIQIVDANTVVNTAFAGQSAGQFFEGEKRFEIVVRLSENNRTTIEDVKALFVTTSNGQQIPLQQIAEINYVTGPNQIQRDDAKRRVVVGFNVRGKDIENVVNTLKEKINRQMQFAPGYYVTYGGAFKNLEEAKSRLLIAVPIALLLIFLLLYFTFQSVVQGLIIYTAIPLSAIGGIFALWVRDMPFSISAGVGFIALFGVAVLNGIVLIAEINQLRIANPTQNMHTLIIDATKTRLRPVLITAAVASLGFLPMALSHGSGAEVQKPLATVVIGGLLTSTLLTLIVLPCIYLLVSTIKNKRSITPVILVLLSMLALNVQAQVNEKITLDQAIGMALKNNNSLLAVAKEKESAILEKRLSSELPKTDVTLLYGQYNGIYNRDNQFTITQGIPFPGTLWAKEALGTAKINAATYKTESSKNEIIRQVKLAYYSHFYINQQYSHLLQIDSAFETLFSIATTRLKKGDGTLLEKTMAESKLLENKNLLSKNRAQWQNDRLQLQVLLNSPNPIDISNTEKQERSLSVNLDSTAVTQNPYLLFLKQQTTIAQKEKTVAINSSMPDFRVGYFNQSLFDVPINDAQTEFAPTNQRFQGVSVGVSIPLWIAPDIAKAQLYKARSKTSELYYKQQEMTIQYQYKQAVQLYLITQVSLEYYKNFALPNAALIQKQAFRSFQLGEINNANYLASMQHAIAIEQNYITTLWEFNKAVIEIEFYLSTK